MKRWFMATYCLFFTACAWPWQRPEAVDPQAWNAAIAAELAVLEIEPATVVPPGPAPSPTTHARANCPTGGWITHGDGHKTRCPNCDPPWTSEPAVQAASFPKLPAGCNTADCLAGKCAANCGAAGIAGTSRCDTPGACQARPTSAPRPHLTPTQPAATYRSGSCASGSCGPATSSGGGGYAAPSFRRFGRRR